MNQTPIYALRFPELADPADISSIGQLAQDVENALQQVAATARSFTTYMSTGFLYFYISNVLGEWPGGGLTIQIDDPNGADFHAVGNFEIRNMGGPGFATGEVQIGIDGYLQGKAAVLEAYPGYGHTTIGTSIAGHLGPGAHYFSLYAKQNGIQWAGHAAVLTIAVGP